MPYNINFPQSLDFMRDSQPLMLQNFANIFSFIDVDHERFNIATAGMHKQLTFPAQPSDPANVSEWRMYSKMVGALVQLFTKNAGNTVSGFSDSKIQPNGQVSWVQLPSGIILKWVIIPSQLTSNPVVLNWANLNDSKPFTTQYWACITPFPSSAVAPAVDIDVILYVNSVSNPNLISYNSWRREGSVIGIDPGGVPSRLVFAIGV